MKIKGKITRKIKTLILAGILALAMAFSSFAGAKEKGETMQAETELDDSTSSDEKAETKKGEVNQMEDDKTETVYAKADAQGNVREITVEATLKNPGSSDNIQDYSTLKDIKNTEGDEEFTDKGNGVIIWENHGEDINYEGKSDGKLPFSVRISYYLDGKEMKPEDLAGKSGKFRMRFDYENLTSEIVEIDGKTVEVQVPFVMFSAAFLSSDVFSNIEVSNGKIVAMDDENIVIGNAYPGLAESLRLSDYEPTKNVELPDYVEITADVVNFELAFTATVATTGALSEMDLDDLDDADDLIDDMEKLTDASSELVDGTAELFDGVEEFRSYMLQYTDGISAVGDGTKALMNGLGTLNEQKAGLETGAAALQSGLEDLNTALQQISMPTESNLNDEDMAALTTAVKALAADAQALDSALSAIQDGLSQIQDFTTQAEAYSQSVQRAADEAVSELDAANLDDVEAAAAEQAKAQAVKAVEAALEGTALSDEEKTAIKEKVAGGIEISGITSEVQAQILAAKERLGSISALEIPDLSSVDAGKIIDIIHDMQNQMSILANYAEELWKKAGDVSEIADLFDMLKNGIDQLAGGSRQLTEGIAAFNQGIEKLYEGSLTLNSGTSKLSTAGDELNNGLVTMSDGVKALCDGMKTFDEEGIQSLADLAGDELEGVLTRFRALKEADSRYINFSGIREGQKGSVKFIVETDEIE